MPFVIACGSRQACEARPQAHTRFDSLFALGFFLTSSKAYAGSAQLSNEEFWLWIALASAGATVAIVVLFLVQQYCSNRRLIEINLRLQAEEQRYRTLVENLPDLVVRYDVNFRRTMANSAYFRLTKLSMEEAIGKTPMETSLQWTSDCTPESLQEFMQSVMENRKPANCLLKFADMGDNPGRYPIYYEYRLVPEFDAEGNITGFLGIGHDVSELKYIQTALQEREAEFHTLMEHLPDVIVRYDEKLRRTYVNPEYLRKNKKIGTSVLGKSPSEVFLLEEQAESYQAELKKVLECATSHDFQLKWPVENGWMYVGVQAVPEFDHTGRVIGVLAVGRDMTSYKELEMQLQESQAMLRALAQRNEAIRETERRHLAREVHDELGQMLTAIRFNLIVLDRKFSQENAEMREWVQILLDQLADTLAMARNIVLALHPSVLDEGIELALDWLSKEFSKNAGIGCSVDVDESVVLDEAQSMVVFRVVQESLTNVAKHSGASRVKISLMQDHGLCRLEVSDNGMGFDASAPPIRKSLGFVGMRERVLTVGGTLNLISASWKGTTVKVEFPMKSAEEKEEAYEGIAG